MLSIDDRPSKSRGYVTAMNDQLNGLHKETAIERRDVTKSNFYEIKSGSRSCKKNLGHVIT